MRYFILLAAILSCCSACVTTPSSMGDNSTISSSFIAEANLQLEKASWLKPIADSVMTLFCEGKTSSACVYYAVISKGAGVAIETIKVAIAAYKKDPSALNMVNLKASIDQLNVAIAGLDAGYKGKI